MMRIFTAAAFASSLIVAGVAAAPAANASATVLVAQCSSVETSLCQNSFTPVPWVDVVTGAQLAALGLGSTQPVIAAQTSCCVIRLGEITATFDTTTGPVIETIPEFSGNFNADPCHFCEVDTIGSLIIPGNALDLTLAGTFGNSLASNSSGVNVYLGAFTATPEPATWALLLTGFAGLGLALRRKTASAAIA